MRTISKIICIATIAGISYFVGVFKGYDSAVNEVARAYTQETNVLKKAPVRYESTLTYREGALNGINDLVQNTTLKFQSTFDKMVEDLYFSRR